MSRPHNRDYEQALQHARARLLSHAERTHELGETLSDEAHDEVFSHSVDFMAAQLGMGDAADSIRSLAQELAPIVQRITKQVDELFIPVLDKSKRLS